MFLKVLNLKIGLANCVNLQKTDRIKNRNSNSFD